jgi:hypothetical protein
MVPGAALKTITQTGAPMWAAEVFDRLCAANGGMLDGFLDVFAWQDPGEIRLDEVPTRFTQESQRKFVKLALDCSHAPTPGRAGQAAHQLPQVALAEPPGGGGQQRTAQLPPLPYPGPLRPVGQVGIQGRHGGRVSGIFAFRALADHPQHRCPESSPRSAKSAAQASSTRRALCRSSRTTAAVRSA